MTLLASREVEQFGIRPKVALVSRSNFGSQDSEQSAKMRRAVEILHARHPDLELDGEMQADAALSERIRGLSMPESRLSGAANLLVMPNVDAANICFNLLKVLGGGVSIGPILIGANGSAHVVSPSVLVRGLVNMSAIAASKAHAPSTVAEAAEA